MKYLVIHHRVYARREPARAESEEKSSQQCERRYDCSIARDQQPFSKDLEVRKVVFVPRRIRTDAFVCERSGHSCDTAQGAIVELTQGGVLRELGAPPLSPAHLLIWANAC